MNVIRCQEIMYWCLGFATQVKVGMCESEQIVISGDFCEVCANTICTLVQILCLYSLSLNLDVFCDL